MLGLSTVWQDKIGVTGRSVVEEGDRFYQGGTPFCLLGSCWGMVRHTIIGGGVMTGVDVETAIIFSN